MPIEIRDGELVLGELTGGVRVAGLVGELVLGDVEVVLDVSSGVTWGLLLITPPLNSKWAHPRGSVLAAPAA
ncbi:MAG: hypothetical protein ABSF61_04505 [Anaerolineales bacterium]